MLKKVLKQKLKILGNIFGILFIFVFFEVFWALPWSFAFINFWLAVFSKDNNALFSPSISSFLIIHSIGLLFIWAARCFTGALYRSFARLFPLLFIFSYIEKNVFPVPIDPGKDVDDAMKLEYMFHPYNVLGEKVLPSTKETAWEAFKGYVSIVMVVVVFYFLVRSELKEYVLPQGHTAQAISYVLIASIHVLMILLPSSKIKEQPETYDTKNS